jgi:hypothetical protein
MDDQEIEVYEEQMKIANAKSYREAKLESYGVGSVKKHKHHRRIHSGLKSNRSHY